MPAARPGKFMAFDSHSTSVIGDCEEFRKLRRDRGKKKNEERKTDALSALFLSEDEEVISMTGRAPHRLMKTRAKAVGAAALAGPGLGPCCWRGFRRRPLVKGNRCLAGRVGGLVDRRPGK
ncbi:hypothetical protein R6Q59_029786 [Mikania micrantha]